ncbi:MAG: cation-translocating P-type ATPase [Clostridia bacterium]|nr:cation-translocating P-type ATPase [Clostridia bacterium]
MKKIILNIEGMTCSACSNGLEKYLNKQEGIYTATVNLVMGEAFIEYDDSIKRQDLVRFIKEAGFKSVGERTKNGNKKYELKLLIFFAMLAIVQMYISMGYMINLPVINFLNKDMNPINYGFILMIITILFIIWGFDIIKNGVKNIIHKMPNMDSLVGMGVFVNFIYSFYNLILVCQGQIMNLNNLYFESSSMILLFIKIGRYIDKKNKAKAIDTIKNLVTITPKKGTIIKEGKEQSVTINEIQKGDIVVSKPGERISVDGIITKGSTHTDESFLTGESNPVSKKIGSSVMAGSINYDGYIEYEAVNIGKDSQISHIVDLVVEATNTKSPIARLADKISGYFVPIIFLISILAFSINFLINNNFNDAIIALVSVLVVACPCSLGLATPLAMIVSIGNASKKGIVIKSSEILETINKIDTIVFDKTGTLTKGNLEVVDEKYIDADKKEEILNLLKSLESKSNHPLAKSIAKNATKLFEVTDFEEISGCGIQGKIQGKMYFAGNKKMVEGKNIKNIFEKEEKEFSKKKDSIIYFFDEENMLGIIGLRDEIKQDMKNIISELKKLYNKEIIMLSGDNEITANTIARELNIENVYSNMSPKEKMEIIQKLNTNQNVIMVGDGINDSPALKTASIGISVVNGTDISSNSSDVILLKDDMNKIIDLFKIGKKTIRIIKENLFWALFYNICMIPLAMGILPIGLNPMIASLAMTLSSLTVVLNSLRLKK